MHEKGRWSEAPRVLHREKPDPELIRALVFSLAGHLALIGLVVAFGSSSGKVVRLPAYRVGLLAPAPDSRVLAVGPLARHEATRLAPQQPAKPKASVAPPVGVKPQPTRIAKPKPAAKAEPKPAAKPEAKPVAKTKPAPKAKPAAKAEPKPAAKPEAKPAAKTKPAPKAGAKPRGPSKQTSTPMTESTAKPQASVLAKPRAPAKATNGVSGRGGRGTQAGGSGGTLVRDAVFLRYYNEMIEAIRSHWVWVGSASAELSVTVRFSIAPDGTIVGVKRTSSSGNPHFDQSVENAIRSVGHLSPPPAKYRRDFADVELLFRASDLTRR